MTLLDAAAQFGISLDDSQLVRFERYYNELLDWNRHVNLTRITSPDDVTIQHFLDSLTCLLAFPAPEPRRPLRLVDIGAGAGFPGLPLKIARPELRLTLLDSVAKKTAFLAHVVAQLQLPDVEVVTGRAEDLGHDPAHRAAYDIAVCRAVAPLVTLAEYCLPLLRIGGRMIAQKTADSAEELREASAAIRLLGGAPAKTRGVSLPGLRSDRLLVIVDKVGTTGTKYPRRSGLPAKKPLL